MQQPFRSLRLSDPALGVAVSGRLADRPAALAVRHRLEVVTGRPVHGPLEARAKAGPGMDAPLLLLSPRAGATSSLLVGRNV